jgi:ABC-type Na+ efflux pump permease subunit
MRGWGSSVVLAVVGALVLWVGIAQFEGAYLPETGVVAGKVARVVPADGRHAIMFDGRDERFVLTTPNLPYPSVQALYDAAQVSVIYDTRAYGRTTRAVVGLSVDGYTYFSPATYQMFSGLLALVLLVPGALLFGLGASALSRRAHGVRDVEDSSDVPALAPQQALIIPFPRRALTDG